MASKSISKSCFSGDFSTAGWRFFAMTLFVFGLAGCASSPKNTMNYYADNTVAFKFNDKDEGTIWSYTNNPSYALVIAMQGVEYNMKDVGSIVVMPMYSNLLGEWGKVIVKLKSERIVIAPDRGVQWRVCEQNTGCKSWSFARRSEQKLQSSEMLKTRAISERYLQKSPPTNAGVSTAAIPYYIGGEFNISSVSEEELRSVISRFKPLHAQWEAGEQARKEQQRIRSISEQRAQVQWLHQSEIGTRVTCRTSVSMHTYAEAPNFTCQNYYVKQTMKSMEQAGWQVANVQVVMDSDPGLAQSGYHSNIITFQKIR